MEYTFEIDPVSFTVTVTCASSSPHVQPHNPVTGEVFASEADANAWIDEEKAAHAYYAAALEAAE
jgi:hypothetical protein